MPDFELCVDELLIEQGRSSLRWTVTGTDVRGVLGIGPGRGPVLVQGTTRSRWGADREVECWVSWQRAR